MKIKVYGKDYCEQIRKFESFIVDTGKYPELAPEVTAIVDAHTAGTKPRDMSELMQKLFAKMWDTEVEVESSEYSYQMSLAECFEPHEVVGWEKFKNEESWLEFESVVTGDEDASDLEETQPALNIISPGSHPSWFPDEFAEEE